MRKASRKLVRFIARLRSRVRADRADLSRRLEDRRLACGVGEVTVTPDEPSIYGPIFDHLDAELATAASELDAAEVAYATAQS